MKQPARRKRRAKGGDDGGTVPPDKNDFFKKRTLKMHTIVATDEAEEDVTIMPSFAGWTFACLGLSAAEETKVREIVRLHRGRMDDGRLDGGRRHLCRYSTCSHVVTGYWLPVTIEADDSAVYVTLHWLEQVHATTQNLPLDSSILFQPPPFHRHSFHLAYPHEYIITDSFDPAMHVELPCVPSSKLCFDIPRWPYVVALLTRPIPDVDALEHVIHLITGQQGTRLRCLRRAIDEYVEDATTLFTVTLPYMVSTALALPLLFPSPVPLLTRQVPSSVTLTKRQAACLIIHAFLCTFTAANTSFNHFHFFDVFAPSAPPDWSNAATTDQDATAVQKLVTVLHYFSRFTTDNLCDNTNHRYDQQVITYARHVLDTTTPSTDSGMAGDSGGWADTLPWTSVHVHANGAIEDDVGAVQVDFANKFAGGGVLGHGCVQEEIRFLMNPECLVACLLTEVLDPTECFVISGTEQYAASSGYGSTFAFAGGVLDLVPVDVNMMRDTVIVGIDATKYYRNNAWHQFRPEDIKRELDKAMVGFQRLPDESPTQRGRRPVATGNWGCGVFKGDVELKFVVQWLAASAQHRPLHYYTFGNSDLATRLAQFVQTVTTSTLSVAQLRARLLDNNAPNCTLSLAEYTRQHRRHRPSVCAYITSTLLPHIRHSPSTVSQAAADVQSTN